MTTEHYLQAIAAFSILSACIFVVMVKLAKPGWQDSDGFHEGEPPQHTDFDGE